MIAQNLEWIKEGYYVDAKDKHNDWQAGLVLSMTKTHIKIRFDGWAARNDEVYPITTQKIKPFRSITKGYTGQPKNPAARQHWHFSLQKHEQRFSEFEQFIENLSQKSGFELNQYLRGENYFYIDFLMTCTYRSLQEFKRVYDYFCSNIQFVRSYLQQFIERDTNAWFQAGDRQEFTSKKVYSDMHYELFEGVYSIVGAQVRMLSFMRNNDRFIKQLAGQQNDYNFLMTKTIVKLQFSEKLELFINKLFDQTQAGMRNLPFSFIYSVVWLFLGLERLSFSKDFKKKILTSLIYIVQQYFNSFNVAEIKVNEKQIQETLGWIRTLSNRLLLDKEQVCLWVEKTKFKLWTSLIQCDVLQKKLRGINKIKEFYDLVLIKLTNPLQRSSIYCNQAQFRQWMNQEQLLKIIFDNNQHFEVIKKGCEMFQSFYGDKHKLCTIEEIVYIWQACFKKHEAIKKIIFQFWNDMADYIAGEDDWRQFIGVLTQNQDNITQEWEMESLFLFLRTLKSNDNEYFHQLIAMIYRKTLQNQKFIPQFAVELSQFGEGSQILRKIVDDCLKGISEKNEPIFHLKLMAKLFYQLKSEKIYLPNNIVDVLIDELREFLNGEENEKLINIIFNLFNEIMSVKDHSNCSQNAFGVKLTLQNFETLWDIFSQAANLQVKKNFYTWIVSRAFSSTYNFYTYSINSRFNQEFRLEIFSNFLCDPRKLSIQTMDLNEFIVFRQFFIYVNSRGGALEVKYCQIGESPTSLSRRIIRVKSKELKGLDYIWQIFKNCQTDEVITAVSTFIKDLYLRVYNTMPQEEKVQRIKSLMEKILSFIKEGQAKSLLFLIKRSLILLTKLLTDIKQRVQIPKDFQRLQRTQKVAITVYVSQTEFKQIDIFPQDPFISVKTQISHMFKLARDEFTLMNSKAQIQKEFYELPFYLHSFTDNHFRIVKIGNEVGKYVVNYVYQNFYQSIIGFLKNENLSMEAFHLLEFLQTYDPLKLFKFLSQEIQDAESIQKNKRKLYLHIYFLRVFALLMDKDTYLADSNVLAKLVSHLAIPIENSLAVSYLQKLIEILANIMKKRPQLLKEQNYNQQQQSRNCNLKENTYKLMLNLVKYINHYPKNITNHEIRLFNFSINFYTVGFQNTRTLFDTFIKDEHFRELMFELFIKCEFLPIKRAMERRISTWLNDGFYDQTKQKQLSHFFINQLYFHIYKKSQTTPLTVEFVGLFKLFRIILQTISLDTFNDIMFSTTSNSNQKFSDHILESIKSQSDTPLQTNYLLNGQLHIFAGMIKRNRSLITEELIEFLLYECLIYSPNKTLGMDVKCLSKQNIVLIVEILWNAMVDVQLKVEQDGQKAVSLSIGNQTQKILANLREFHYLDFWRNYKDWNFPFQQISRPKSLFVGLQNPGCICYLNSLLQQLYMIEEFRYSILNMNTGKIENESQTQVQTTDEDSPQLIQKLKLLFLNLMFSERSSIDPLVFTNAIKTASNRPMVKIFQQMDIDEFSMILFDKIENKLNRIRSPNFIRQLFGGTYSNEVISKDCKHSSEREEPFLSISLDVKKHIADSFQSLVKGEMLEGENAYFCDQCDKKVRALKRLSIKRLPPHLIISLRRFEFDYQIDQKIKINKYCEFPLQLNLQSYTQGKLNQINQKSKSVQVQQMQQDSSRQQSKQFPSDYYIYRLKGVVVHTGSADSGHYYSFIENKDGNWFQFNDEKVSEFDVSNLEDEAFGGKDGEYMRIKNAYLLFYERKAKNVNIMENNESRRVSQRVEERSRRSDEMIVEVPNSSQKIPHFDSQVQREKCLRLRQNIETIEQIIMYNKKMRIFQFFFSKDYFQLVMGLVHQVYRIYGISPDQSLRQLNQYSEKVMLESSTKVIFPHVEQVKNNPELLHELFRYLISYTFLIQLRQKHQLFTFELLQTIRNLFFQHQDLHIRKTFLQIFLHQITNKSFFEEFLLQCINRDKSKIVANFLFEAIESYILICIQQNDMEQQLVKKIIKLIMKNVILSNTNIPELLMILRKILFSIPANIQTNLQTIQFIIHKDFVNVLLDNALGLPIPKQTQLNLLAALEEQPITYTNQNLQDPSQNYNYTQTFLQVPEEGKNKNPQQIAQNTSEAAEQGKMVENEKIQIEGIQTENDFSTLFGSYKQVSNGVIKTSDKETWTLLWEIWNAIQKQKNIIQNRNQVVKPLNLKGIKQERKIQSVKERKSQQIKESKCQQIKERKSQSIKERKSQSIKEKESISPNRSQPPSEQMLSIPLPIVDSPYQNLIHSSQANQSLNQSHINGEGVSNSQISGQDLQSPRQNSQGQLSSLNEEELNAAIEYIGNQIRANAQGEIQPKSISPQTHPEQIQCKENTHDKNKGANDLTPIIEENVSPTHNSNTDKTQAQLSSHKKQVINQSIISVEGLVQKLQNSLKKITADKLMKVIAQQKDTKSAVALAAFITNFIKDNNVYNQVVLVAIQSGLKDYESTKYRSFFILIEKFMEIDDSLARKRRTSILRLLRSALKQNQKYFTECDFVQQWILRYAARFPLFQVTLRQNPGFINQIKIWLSQKRQPGLQTIKKYRQPNCERLTFKLHGILVSGQIKEYEKLGTYKLECFEKIQNNKFVSLINYHDLNKPGESYKKGDIVKCYFDQNLWVEGIVESTYYGIVLVYFNCNDGKTQKFNFMEDDERILLYKPSFESFLEEITKMEIEK